MRVGVWDLLQDHAKPFPSMFMSSHSLRSLRARVSGCVVLFFSLHLYVGIPMVTFKLSPAQAAARASSVSVFFVSSLLALLIIACVFLPSGVRTHGNRAGTVG